MTAAAHGGRRPGDNRAFGPTTTNDLFVVETAVLAAVMRRWIFETDALGGTEGRNCSGRVDPDRLNATHQLVERLGVDESVVYRLLRRHTTRYTGLAKADAVLQAMRLTHLMHDGTITVLRNPNISERRWRSALAAQELTPEDFS